MALRSEPVFAFARPRGRASIGVWLDRPSVFSWLMMAPPLLWSAIRSATVFC
jgi:hypothetical protein